MESERSKVNTGKYINGLDYIKMISGGAARLRAESQRINDLNVFPIPDGDTGDNMLMTVMGGAGLSSAGTDSIGVIAQKAANGMLLSARGNSGVITSQFFDGIAAGLSEYDSADSEILGKAFNTGVKHAYNSVLQPAEGTILTVAKDASEYAQNCKTSTPAEFLTAFIDEAKRSLDRTPDLLPVLKKAGVVDSGGAGLICIAQGMLEALNGEASSADEEPMFVVSNKLDLDKFTENSILEFGYCTELLLRLQNSKTDTENFSVETITDFLTQIGDSVVAFKTGTIVKIHVHTMTPDKVLAFCQRYGEFLTIKIENMSLQHNNVAAESPAAAQCAEERKPYGIVAVASGDGLKQAFSELGADIIVDGGQSMNPSTEDFISAFDKVNADTIFVFPNNGNIILAANQAAHIYKNSDVRVIESRTIGEGYSALTMLDTDSGSVDEILETISEAMEGVITASVSKCVRDASMDGIEMHIGDYIGFVGKNILSASENREEAVKLSLEKLGLSDHEICIIVRGTDSTAEEADRISSYINANYRNTEVYIIDGQQDVYSYILIVE